MITSSKAGVSTAAAQTKLKALKDMEFHIKTAYRTSPGSFTSRPDSPVLGQLQGSACFSPNFGMIFSLIFSVINHLHEQAIFQSPHPKTKSTRNQEGFIDDTTNWETRR